MHALLISALSLPPRHISDGLPPRQLSEITCDTPLSCNAARHILAKESRKPSIFQGVWHRKETFIQPGLEETTLQRTESQRM